MLLVFFLASMHMSKLNLNLTSNFSNVIMVVNSIINHFSRSLPIRELKFVSHVRIHPNITVRLKEPYEPLITFLEPTCFKPPCLQHFGWKLSSLLFTPLISFLHPLLLFKVPLSFSLAFFPPSYVHPSFLNHVCQLRKALYGLK